MELLQTSVPRRNTMASSLQLEKLILAEKDFNAINAAFPFVAVFNDQAIRNSKDSLQQPYMSRVQTY